jgi:hypothetical protein
MRFTTTQLTARITFFIGIFIVGCVLIGMSMSILSDILATDVSLANFLLGFSWGMILTSVFMIYLLED